MLMRSPRDNVLSHGGREQSNMSTSELIDVSLEDDSLLPCTISPPEDRKLTSVLRLSPPDESVPKTPGAPQIPFPGSKESDNKVSVSTSKASAEENALLPDSALSSLGSNPSSAPRVTISATRSDSAKNPQNSTGNMAKSEEKLSSRAVLTPTRARAISWNNSKSGGGDREMEEEQPPKQVDGQENRSSQAENHSAVAPAPDKPARKPRSKRAMHSLRKSLAWDKAFSTDEGILDGDELPLFTKTPKKLPELPPLDLPEILALVSPAAKSAAVSITQKPSVETCDSVTPTVPNHGMTKNTDSLSESGEVEAPPTSGNEKVRISNDARPVNSQTLSSAITSPIHLKPLTAIPRPVPVTQVIEEAVEKGTKLRLPSLVVHAQNKVDKGYEAQARSQKEAEIVSKHRQENEHALPVKLQKDSQTLTRCRSTSALMKPPSTSTSISKKVSSVSKKVKDTLGRVLPGSMGGRSSANRKALAETAHADRLRPVTSTSQSSATGLKVPTSPGPSYMTRSKSARAALSGFVAEPNVQKTGVLAELSNKPSSSKASGKHPAVQKKSKGESIWGSLRGKSGSSSTRGSEHVPQSIAIPSPATLKKTGGTENATESSKPHDSESSHTDTSRDLSLQIGKPSGLRLPSPKIGFFDSGRTAINHEKPTAVVPDANSKAGLPPRPPLHHGSTSARFAQPTTVDPMLAAAVRCYLSSGIPAAPHVTRPTGKGARKGLVPSASAPASPRKDSEMLSPGTHRAVTGRYLTSRSNVTRIQIDASPGPEKVTSGAVRKLTLEPSDGKVETNAKEAPVKEITSSTLGLEDVPQSIARTPSSKCSKQPADEIVDSMNKVTDSPQPSLEQNTEERRTGSNAEISSEHTMGTDRRPTLDDAVKAALSGDSSVTVLASSPRVKSDNDCIHHLVQSLHDSPNSPSIQATFWDLQRSHLHSRENAGESDQQRLSNGTDPPGAENVSREDIGTSVEAESCPEGLDQVNEVKEVHHEKFISEFATSSSGRDHGRRKSIFGWQEDVLAGFSPPVVNAVRSSEQPAVSQQTDESVSPCLDESFHPGTPDELSTPRTKRGESLRNKERGQIMNGAIIDELRGESFKLETGRSNISQSSVSAEKKGECTSASKTLENESLQTCKLENLFDMNWSGAPVSDAARQASSGSREETGVRAPPAPKGPDSAEKSHLVNCGSLLLSESSRSDAGASSDGRSPLAVNRALLNTATDGSRLSITPPLKKERGLFALARSAVSRLTSAASGGLSPRNENSRAVDRDGPGSGSFRKSKKQKSNTKGDNHSQEDVRNLESASPSERNVEEELLMRRGGAVQHSPPNKTQPPPNPWSPVKKGQHPGPFDCTKKWAWSLNCCSARRRIAFFVHNRRRRKLTSVSRRIV
ncbi:hypothetical protein R1flu_017777 [Riccia fluitans]|uniref:Uncharacterized protein n=1 Tax=Riccia fluitans TaxID=41844 RepID=A0ABD1ZDY2_9MARC